MKNIIRFKIHYGGNLQYRMGMRDIVNQNIGQRNELAKTFNLNESKFITNEQEIVLILSKLQSRINSVNNRMSNRASIPTKEKYIDEMNEYFQNLDNLIKGKFDLIKNTKIDQSQFNQIKINYPDEVNLVNLTTSNCVGLKFIEVIFNSYHKIEKSYIDVHILNKIYKLCLPFKDQLLLFDNYNSFFYPIKDEEKFVIAKSFFDSKENIVPKLSKDDLDLI